MPCGESRTAGHIHARAGLRSSRAASMRGRLAALHWAPERGGVRVSTSRRRFLYLLGLGSAGGLLAACTQGAPASSPTRVSTAAAKPVAPVGTAVPADHPTIAG